MKKWEETVVKISAKSEYFSVLVLKVDHSKLWLFKPIFRHLDPESGSEFRIRIPDLVMSTISKRIQKVFIFLYLFWYRIGTNPFVPDRNRNKEERLHLLLEKLERKRTFLFVPGWTNKKEHLYLLQAKVEQKGINPSV